MDLYAGSTKSKRERYEQLAGSLKSIRQGGGFDAHWRDIAELMHPRRVRFTTSDRNKGDRRAQRIIDSTATFAANTLRSGLHAGLTSPARPWFTLSTPDPDLAEFGPVKEWLHITTERMQTVFSGTNLYNALPALYVDFGLFGIGAMSQLEDTKDLFRSFVYPLGSWSIGLDTRGVASTFCLEYELSVRQVVEQFGVEPGRRDINWQPISSAVKTLWDNGDYEKAVPLIWLVKPNDQQDRSRLEARYAMPFTSCYFEMGERQREGADRDKFLRESGFREFPVYAPRWDITGNDSYGTDCPGMTALGDVLQLQGEQKQKARLLAKAVEPPLKGPSVLRSQKVSTIPGDITYVDTREGMSTLSPIHEPRLEGFQHISADIQDVRFLIRRAFYEDLFLMLQSSDPSRGAQPVTAREIDERHEEKLIALGPTLERTNDELLKPLIDRTYAMMQRAGLLPEPPNELDGVTLKVEFTSILAAAQKMVGVTQLDRFMQTMVTLVPVFPEISDKVDTDQVVENYGERLAIDPRIIRSTEEAAARTKAREQQQQAMLQAQQAKDLAGAAAQAGAQPVAPDSALDRVLTAVRG